jgi:multiple sugar transport system substrate-binding protein
MTASLLTGCGGTASTSGAKTDSSEKTTVTLWHYFDGQAQQTAMETLATKFNASQDKIKVEVEFVPRAELTKQFTIGLVADKLPDIGLVDNPDMASFSAMGLFADVTNKVNELEYKDKFYDGPLSSCVLDGKYYGLPLGSNDLAIYYNKDMFTAAGVTPPTTFDELKTSSKKLTQGDTYGLAIAAPKNEEGTFQYLPWLLATGAKYNEIGTEAGIKSLQYLTDLIKDGSMSKEVINWTQNDLEKQFATKKAAMIVDGPWIISTLKKDAPDLNWGVVKVPKDKIFASDLGGENWGIIKGHHEDAAWEFIKFTQQEDIMKAYCADFGYIPSRKDIAEKDEAITKDPNMSVFLDELQYSYPRGPHAKWPEISDAMSTAMQESFTNAKTPEQAAKDAQVKVNAVIK